jgi:hypothetical protein
VRLAPDRNSRIGFDIDGLATGRFHCLIEKGLEFLRDPLILNSRRHHDSPPKQRKLLENPIIYLHFHHLVSPHAGLNFVLAQRLFHEERSLPPFDFAQDKLRRESRRLDKDWIPASAGMTEKAVLWGFANP